tara:strand:+ start:1162 stop:2370 length:1209 start_codon:yes stop_codon:yes gene_type:complete
MTLLSELRSTEYNNETMYSYLYGLKYEDRIDEHDIEVDFLNDVDRMLSRYFIRNDMTRYRRLTNLFGDIIDHFSKCEDCGSWEYEDDVRWAYDDNPICSNCIDNYRYSENRDTYVSEDDYYDEESESQHDDYIYEYNEDVMSHCSYQVSDKDRTELYPLYMGVELEVERRNDCPYEIGEMTHNDFYNSKTGQFAIMKSDGSLSNGFEIVTAPATLNAHRENWDTFLNGAAIKHLKSWNTDTTGMHIHISRNHLTQLDIGKLLVFINDYKNEEFVNHIAGRNSDQWAKKSSKKISDAVNSSEKYEAVNMSHRNTIEFRIFKGNLAKQGLFRVMEFVHALVGFSKTTSMTKLSYKDFIRYMELPQNRSEYKIFYGWLTRKSYCIGKPSRSVDWSDEQNNLREIA